MDVIAVCVGPTRARLMPAESGSPRVVRLAHDARVEIFHAAPDSASNETPICVFCGGGGWQGLDHINRHEDIANQMVQAGFVVAIVRHRPVAISTGPAALFVACSFLAASLLLMHLGVALSPVALGVGLPLVCFGFAMATELFNRCRGAVSLAEVVDDVARGVAAVRHDPRFGGRTTAGSVGDSTKLVFVGNSSGGHLLSLLALDHRWLDALGVAPRSHIKAVVDVSGVATLCSPLWAPFRWLLLAFLLGFDGCAAEQLSPLTHATALASRSAMDSSLPTPATTRWYLLVAQYELPSLRALSRAFGAELERGGCPLTYIEVPRRLHFTAINDVKPVLERVRRDLSDCDSDQNRDVGLDAGEDDCDGDDVPPYSVGVPPYSVGAALSDDRMEEGVCVCPMAVADAVFLLVDFAITSCVELEVGAPLLSLSQLQHIVAAASGVHRVMRARALRVGRRAYWQPCERRFRTSHHAFAMTAESLEEAIEREASTPLPKDRPPWRVSLVTLPSQNRQCLVLTIHHCIGDGAFIATALLQPLLGVTPPTPPPQKRRAKLIMGKAGEGWANERAGSGGIRQRIGRIHSLLLEWSPLVYQPAAWLSQLLAFISGSTIAPDESASLTLACSSTLHTSPESDVGAIRAATGASVTDIVLCAIASQLRQLLDGRQRHQSQGGSICVGLRRPLLAFVPVMAGVPDMSTSLRHHCGNAVSGFLLALPVHLASPTARLRRIVKQTRLAKRSYVAISMGAIARLGLQLLPPPLLPWIVPLLADAATCCGVSSLRGPIHAACKGSNVDALYFYGLFRPPRMPLMLGAASIGDRLRITLALKLEAGPEVDAKRVLDGLPAALAELREDVCGCRPGP